MLSALERPVPHSSQPSSPSSNVPISLCALHISFPVPHWLFSAVFISPHCFSSLVFTPWAVIVSTSRPFTSVISLSQLSTRYSYSSVFRGPRCCSFIFSWFSRLEIYGMFANRLFLPQLREAAVLVQCPWAPKTILSKLFVGRSAEPTN